MSLEQLIIFGAKLMTWMETNAPGEPEPTIGGEKFSTVIARESKRRKKSAVPLTVAAVNLVDQILAVYATHEHAEEPEED